MDDKPNLRFDNVRPVGDAVSIKRCGNCAAFKKNAQNADGECRLTGPALQILPLPNRLGQVELRSLAGWPPVASHEHCVAFRPKIEGMN
ncbi:MAG: hypothetical protein KGL39_29630 [Patescibacteria group bacterium]|nr:hypothetical protein [Patescibacteria group bacterium]